MKANDLPDSRHLLDKDTSTPKSRVPSKEDQVAVLFLIRVLCFCTGKSGDWMLSE